MPATRRSCARRSVLLRHRRGDDCIARTGGEEFTILLPGATEHEAYLVAENIRTAVEHEFRNDPAVLTFSFGVATFPDHGGTADSVLEAADQALYAAKALGRNRCVIFNPELSAIFAPDDGAAPTSSSSRRSSRSPRRSTSATRARPTTRGPSAATPR